MSGAFEGYVGDRQVADFRAGSVDGGVHIAATAAGAELILKPAVAAEFTGDRLPDEWFIEPWKEGGRAQLGDGRLSLDGASAGHRGVFGSQRSLEFVATFQKRPHQHVGFAMDFKSLHWITFSTKFGNTLYARSNFFIPEDNRLPGSLLGSPHRFRIDWNLLDVDFWIDGRRVVHQLVPMVGYLRPLASNGGMGGEPLTVDWVRMTPYAPRGSFTSRVLDAGAPARWVACEVDVDLPEKAGLTVEVRGGDSPAPDETWTGWATLANETRNGAALVSRFVQYRAWLASSDRSATPVVRGVQLRYSSSSSSSSSSSGSGTTGGASTS